MAWLPDPALPLYNNDELLVKTPFVVNTFSYTPADPIADPETYTITGITTNLPDSGVVVSTSISGQYSGVAHGGMTVLYMNKQGAYFTVDDFDEIVNSHEICSYTPPTQKYATYVYTVTATGNLGTVRTQDYTIISTFNWDTGKNALQSAVAKTISER